MVFKKDLKNLKSNFELDRSAGGIAGLFPCERHSFLPPILIASIKILGY
jgi:hypothetical protein